MKKTETTNIKNLSEQMFENMNKLINEYIKIEHSQRIKAGIKATKERKGQKV